MLTNRTVLSSEEEDPSDDEAFKPTAQTLRMTRPDSRRSPTRTAFQLARTAPERLNYQHSNQ
ncbi:hypothetical protein BpHYR1_026601 [Brachionus plicatilis]|uniref:Uncharacterized protein n=1 Tax=Brachionus plicatilis TaxID=10195 RepID=A0A3M7P673_BRAPC|nr:hypothetical protein BpHYR1_026601 [Brachionus plicatilis]